MNFSFGARLVTARRVRRPAARPAPHLPGPFDMSLGPASKGAANTTPFGGTR